MKIVQYKMHILSEMEIVQCKRYVLLEMKIAQYKMYILSDMEIVQYKRYALLEMKIAQYKRNIVKSWAEGVQQKPGPLTI